MKQNWKTATCSLVVITLTTLLIINGQKQAKNEDQPDVTQFPTVEYQTRKHVNLSEERKKKSKKYNSRHTPVITESLDQISMTSDWELRLPALPVAKSAAVIIGEVTDAQAHLSEDETRVYSEFIVRVDEVLKSDGQVQLDSSVAVERFGGRVRFPSGKVMVAATDHQDLPHVGKRYVLFLIHEFVGDEDYTILTGYELRDGRVFPLDKPGRGHPILAYKGVSEASLLNDLGVALANSLSQSK
ncbi:MAG: hypothetical protein AABN95_23895 [Acidobacteriota bacterium]